MGYHDFFQTLKTFLLFKYVIVLSLLLKLFLLSGKKIVNSFSNEVKVKLIFSAEDKSKN